MKVEFVRKDQSRLMRFVGWLLRPINKEFMQSYWTTIGHTIYYPVDIEDPSVQQYSGVREHEEMHVAQFDKYGIVLMGLAYILFPLPFLFSGRWFIERGPYLNDIRKGRVHLSTVVRILWGGYGWPWPKCLMVRWFLKGTRQ